MMEIDSSIRAKWHGGKRKLSDITAIVMHYTANTGQMATAKGNARFYGCQFVIATHSPFLLTLKGVRIYDLDRTPVSTCRWTEMKNVRTFSIFQVP